MCENRKKRGYFLRNGKKYVVYDGVNIIGRNPKATVVFKDVVISHQQSILIVVNDEHYISDCDSNNGTYLENLKLQPFLLYNVGDNSHIQFASISATYCKIKEDADIVLSQLSQASNNDNVFSYPTQNLSQRCNESNNDNVTVTEQKATLENTTTCHSSQNSSLSINEMQTQVFQWDTNIMEKHSNNKQTNISHIENVNICDLPTQIFVTTDGEPVREEYIEHQDKTNELVSDASNCHIEQAVVDEFLHNDLTDTTLSTHSPISHTSSSQLHVAQNLTNTKQNVTVSDKKDVEMQNVSGEPFRPQNSKQEKIMQPKQKLDVILSVDEDENRKCRHTHSEDSDDSINFETMQLLRQSVEDNCEVPEAKNAANIVHDKNDSLTSDVKNKENYFEVCNIHRREFVSSEDTDFDEIIVKRKKLVKKRQQRRKVIQSDSESEEFDDKRSKEVNSTHSDSENFIKNSVKAVEQMNKLSSDAETDIEIENKVSGAGYENQKSSKIVCTAMSDSETDLENDEVPFSPKNINDSKTHVCNGGDSKIKFSCVRDENQDNSDTDIENDNILSKPTRKLSSTDLKINDNNVENVYTEEKNNVEDAPNNNNLTIEDSVIKDDSICGMDEINKTVSKLNTTEDVNLNDSDFIPSTQEGKPQNDTELKHSKQHIVTVKGISHLQSEALVSNNVPDNVRHASCEESLTESFQLILSCSANTSTNTNIESSHDNIKVEEIQVTCCTTSNDFRIGTNSVTLIQAPLAKNYIKEEIDDDMTQAVESNDHDVIDDKNLSSHNESSKKYENIVNDDSVFLLPTQEVVEETSKSTQLKVSRNLNVETDDIFLLPTQALNDQTAELNVNERHVVTGNRSSESNMNDVNFIFSLPTQPVDELSQPTGIKDQQNLNTKNNDVFLLPTQVLDQTVESNVEERHLLVENSDVLKDKVFLKDNESDINSDAVFLLPTQQIVDQVFESTRVKNKKNSDTQNDVFLLPTQVLDDQNVKSNVQDINLATENSNVLKAKELHTISESHVNDDSIFLLPTQQVLDQDLDSAEARKSQNLNTESDHVFLLLNQPLDGQIAESNIKEKYLRAQNKSSLPIKNFSVHTQRNVNVDNSVFLLPTQPNEVLESKEQNLNTENDDIFLLPTQPLCTENQENDKQNVPGNIKLSEKESTEDSNKVVSVVTKTGTEDVNQETVDIILLPAQADNSQSPIIGNNLLMNKMLHFAKDSVKKVIFNKSSIKRNFQNFKPKTVEGKMLELFKESEGELERSNMGNDTRSERNKYPTFVINSDDNAFIMATQNLIQVLNPTQTLSKDNNEDVDIFSVETQQVHECEVGANARSSIESQMEAMFCSQNVTRFNEQSHSINVLDQQHEALLQKKNEVEASCSYSVNISTNKNTIYTEVEIQQNKCITVSRRKKKEAPPLKKAVKEKRSRHEVKTKINTKEDRSIAKIKSNKGTVKIKNEKVTSDENAKKEREEFKSNEEYEPPENKSHKRNTRNKKLVNEVEIKEDIPNKINVQDTGNEKGKVIGTDTDNVKCKRSTRNRDVKEQSDTDIRIGEEITKLENKDIVKKDIMNKENTGNVKLNIDKIVDIKLNTQSTSDMIYNQESKVKDNVNKKIENFVDEGKGYKRTTRNQHFKDVCNEIRVDEETKNTENVNIEQKQVEMEENVGRIINAESKHLDTKLTTKQLNYQNTKNKRYKNENEIQDITNKINAKSKAKEKFKDSSKNENNKISSRNKDHKIQCVETNVDEGAMEKDNKTIDNNGTDLTIIENIKKKDIKIVDEECRTTTLSKRSTRYKKHGIENETVAGNVNKEYINDENRTVYDVGVVKNVVGKDLNKGTCKTSKIQKRSNHNNSNLHNTESRTFEDKNDNLRDKSDDEIKNESKRENTLQKCNHNVQEENTEATTSKRATATRMSTRKNTITPTKGLLNSDNKNTDELDIVPKKRREMSESSDEFQASSKIRKSKYIKLKSNTKIKNTIEETDENFKADTTNVENKESGSIKMLRNKPSSSVVDIDENSKDTFMNDITKIKARSKRRNTSQSNYNDFDSTSSTPQKKKRHNSEYDNSTLDVPNSTPSRNKRAQKMKVVFTMLDNPQIETSIRGLGGVVVDTVDSCTVLLTQYVKRSQKLLTAVGQGKPICHPNWIHESKRANKFLDPWENILRDDEAEKKWNFSLRESLNRSLNGKLLESYLFLLIVNSAEDVLRGAIEACGGKCVSRAPPKKDMKNFVVVSCAENKNKYVKYLKQSPKPFVVTMEAIFDGVLRQELHFEDHLLK